jgi:uncharacterized OsmC-like protein
MATDDVTTIAIDGHGQGPKSTHVEAADAEFVVGKEASPLEYFLGSLAACINVIGHMVAKDRGLRIRDLDVRVEGDIDARKYRGESTEPRAGFQTVRVDVSVDADADDDELRDWLDAVAARCPVADNIQAETSLDATVEQM